ncbi:NAD(P)H-binding protein [Bremerella sp. JC817]|uniref:SDR family oxidoreductase n=1 Tax=Bremerella sp. JC817 TaxID=3231756 RepID=UPI0034593D97
MKIVVMGGFGLIGAQVVAQLQDLGHEVVAASPRSGVNAVTGEGLTEVMRHTDVVIDVINSSSFADDDVMAFFDGATKNLLAAEESAGVRHHIVVSIVGADQIPDSGYMRAKLAQETRIREGNVPFTILRATQFMEFLSMIGDFSMVGGNVLLAPSLIQPVATIDVVSKLVELAQLPAANETIDFAGPERFRMDEVIQRVFTALGDARVVTTEPSATYFGADVSQGQLVPQGEYVAGPTSFDDWLASVTVQA